MVFQVAVDGALPVHGDGSVHAVLELREDATELHHLTGRYLCNPDWIAPCLVRSNTKSCCNHDAETKDATESHISPPL